MLQLPLDILNAFGPMALMHAALDRVGAGMPCGVIARFLGRSPAEVEAAVGRAAARFPVLSGRLVWDAGRPVLTAVAGHDLHSARPPFALSFKSSPDSLFWSYRVVEDGEDTWLAAVWAHAGADGMSMLRFVEAVGCALRHAICEVPCPPARPLGRVTSMTAWLPAFVAGRWRPFMRLADNDHSPGVAAVTIPPSRSNLILRRASESAGSVAGWLAAASCMAVCDQQGGRSGQISLNVSVQRDNLQRFGGFGFGVGSLIMPVAITPQHAMPMLAGAITRRTRTMAAQNWDGNLEAFLGRRLWRHRLFARLRAWAPADPTLNVSWKGRWPGLGGPAGVRDVACFGLAPGAHISAHADANGLSISVASLQSPAARADFLQQIVHRLGGDEARAVTELDWLHGGAVRQRSLALAEPA